ncbi:MAG: hypothetical protein HY308_04085 [Gammaproteobacteria bacterium]|nr:hypothetical protein [Gammaproteobacteria bacterium]
MVDITIVLTVHTLLALIVVQLSRKAGYSAWLGLFALFPGLSVGILVYLALSSWPVGKKLERFALLPLQTAPKVFRPSLRNVSAKELRKAHQQTHLANEGW